jgi:glycosyltransferase involved in cell wall biosynthesis
MFEKNKIGVLGLRGFPFVMGGVEKHCEQLYPHLAKMGFQIIVCRRKNYVSENAKKKKFDGIRFIDVWAPKNKHLEAIVHSLIGVFLLKLSGMSILHIHSFGPGIVLPIAKILGFRTVLTYHLPNYHQKKWSNFDRFVLKTFEQIACRFSDRIICVSETNRTIVRVNTGKESCYIPNGVNLHDIENPDVSKFGLQNCKYILAACRFVPEKGLHILIDAYSEIKTDWKLVIAGGADHESKYSNDLKSKGVCNKNIIFTGVLTGKDLESIFYYANLFVLPSFIEGQPIALLEAMSYGIPFIVSDIPAHREMNLNEKCYFKPEDTKVLKEKLLNTITDESFLSDGRKYRLLVNEKYNWDLISKRTAEVYKALQ